MDDDGVEFLTKGNRYVVLDSYSPSGKYIKVARDNGDLGEYRSRRFRLVPPAEPQRVAEAVTEFQLALPDGNPKTRFGVAKPPLSLIPGQARVLLAEAFRDGARKYGPANWRVDPVTASTYLNAAERHLISWQDGEENAEDSGVHHLAHAAACLLILLDAQASGTLKDDRPTPANTSRLIRENTKPLA